MIASIAFFCSEVNSAAGAARTGSNMITAPRHSAAHQRARGSDDRHRLNGISGLLLEKRPRPGSLVEMLRLVVDVLGAEIGRGVLGQRLLGPGGLLHRVLLPAGGERLRARRRGRRAARGVAAIADGEEAPTLSVAALAAADIIEIGDRPLVEP